MRWRLAILVIMAWLLVGPPASAASRPLDLINQQIIPGGSGEFVLPNAYPIRGLVVDNHTATYLRVSSSFTLIPPFTIGWSEDQAGIASIKLSSVVGPNGEPVTTGGANAVVNLYGTPQGNSSGSRSWTYQENVISGGPIVFPVAGIQLGLTQLGGIKNLGPASPLKTVYLLRTVSITAIDRTASTQGVLVVLLNDVTQAFAITLWEFTLGPTAPLGITWDGPIDFAAIANREGFAVGDSLQLQVSVSDTVGTGTYDVAFNALETIQ